MVATRKMVQAIYGGHQPRDVTAAVALGILAGALVGGNVSFVPVLLAAILFNVHTRLFLAAWLASLLLAWLSRGMSEQLGQFLLDGTPLGQTIGLLGDGILAALLGWDQYAVVGCFVAGTTAALTFAPIAYWITRRLNQTRLQTSELTPASRPRDLGRPLVKVWYGLSSREQTARQTMPPRRLRPCGIPATLAAAITMAVATWSLARLSMERELWRQLSAYNGAEVSGTRTQLSLWSGDFLAHDLAIADPTRPERDRFRIGIAKGRLSPGLLLRGRLNLEKLVLARVRVDAARSEAARVYDVHRISQAASKDRNLQTYSTSSGDLEVTRYIQPWGSVCRRLGDLQRLVTAVEGLRSAEEIVEPSGHRRSDLGRSQPRVAVQELRIEALPTTWNLGAKALVEITSLSSGRSLAVKPTQARILLPKFGAEVQLDFAREEARPHAMRFWACDVDVGQWIDAPLAVSGRARFSGQGSFDRQQFDLRLLAEIESLGAEVTGPEPLMGVEPELWNHGCKQLAACSAQLACFGAWTSPDVVLDAKRLVQQFNGRLRANGELALVAAIEQRIARHLEREAAMLEETLALPGVVQASAIEMQPAATESQPGGTQPGGIVVQAAAAKPPALQAGLCDFSAEEDGPMVGDTRPQATEPEANASHFTYPTTSVPYDDTDHVSAPGSVAYEDAESLPDSSAPPGPTSPERSRALPGPVQMAVGRDRYVGSHTPLAAFGAEAESAPREGAWTRWTNEFRQKVGRAFAKPKRAFAGPPEPAEEEFSPQYDDRPIPAAASEAWYKRKWR